MASKRKPPQVEAEPLPVWHQYAHDVVDGKILAGRLVRLACQRHLKDLVDGKERGLVFDEERAEHIVSFFHDYLKHSVDPFAGQPFILLPFQQFIVGSLFGWLGPDGSRRFRTAYIEIGKGNGKTPLGAGIANYGALVDGEEGAEVYFAATKLAQALIGFRDAKLQAEASPELCSAYIIDKYNLTHAPSNSFVRPVSSEKRGLDGPRPHIAIIDEIHEHPDSTVIDKLRAGAKGRRQPMFVELTNSGFNRETVCWQHHDLSIKVLEAAATGADILDTWFAYVCQLDIARKGEFDNEEGVVEHSDIPERDEDGRPVDPALWLRQHPELWIKANPSLGEIIQPRYIAEQLDEAISMPSKRSVVLRLSFCVWTESHEVWIPSERWDSCREDYTEGNLEGERCFGGLDLATTTDLASFVLVFPPEDPDPESKYFLDGRPAPAPWRTIVRAWCPEERIKELAQAGSGIPWDLWARQGFITPHPGEVLDQRIIRREILSLMSRFKVQQIGYDSWNAHQMVTELQEDIGEDILVPVVQGIASLNAPSKAFEEKIRSRAFRHAGSPLYRHCMLNTVRVEDPSGNIRPSKKKSTGKIDPIVATVIAMARAILVVPTKSYYNTHDLFVLG